MVVYSIPMISTLPGEDVHKMARSIFAVSVIEVVTGTQARPSQEQICYLERISILILNLPVPKVWARKRCRRIHCDRKNLLRLKV